MQRQHSLSIVLFIGAVLIFNVLYFTDAAKQKTEKDIEREQAAKCKDIVKTAKSMKLLLPSMRYASTEMETAAVCNMNQNPMPPRRQRNKFDEGTENWLNRIEYDCNNFYELLTKSTEATFQCAVPTAETLIELQRSMEHCQQEISRKCSNGNLLVFKLKTNDFKCWGNEERAGKKDKALALTLQNMLLTAEREAADIYCRDLSMRTGNIASRIAANIVQETKARKFRKDAKKAIINAVDGKRIFGSLGSKSGQSARVKLGTIADGQPIKKPAGFKQIVKEKLRKPDPEESLFVDEICSKEREISPSSLLPAFVGAKSPYELQKKCDRKGAVESWVMYTKKLAEELNFPTFFDDMETALTPCKDFYRYLSVSTAYHATCETIEMAVPNFETTLSNLFSLCFEELGKMCMVNTIKLIPKMQLDTLKCRWPQDKVSLYEVSSDEYTLRVILELAKMTAESSARVCQYVNEQNMYTS